MTIRIIPAARRLLPLAAVLVLASAAPALAQEPTPMQKFMDAIGLIEIPKDSINYRERAPLVVPPTQALIPPRNADDIRAVNPDWPVDHDARGNKLSKAQLDESMRTDNSFYSGARLGREELDRGRISRAEAARRPTAKAEEGRGDWNLLFPSQLGFKGWGSKKEETVVFSGEPERRHLTEPPPGLRTPSKDAPYGVVTEQAKPFKRDPFARATEGLN